MLSFIIQKMFSKSVKRIQLSSLNSVLKRNYSSATPDQPIHQSLINDAIVLSDSCVDKLKQLCDNNGFLRICVESGGCSGFQYKFDLDDKLQPDDKVFAREGVKVVVDETSLEYIKGATIDYHTELIRSAFRVVQNPNADLGCSCGASFSIKLD